MINVLTNSIPSQYLFPLAFGASINKRFVLPVASKVADFITINTGLATPEDLKYTHDLYNQYIQNPVGSVADSLEDAVIGESSKAAIESLGGTFSPLLNPSTSESIPVVSENPEKQKFISVEQKVEKAKPSTIELQKNETKGAPSAGSEGSTRKEEIKSLLKGTKLEREIEQWKKTGTIEVEPPIVGALKIPPKVPSPTTNLPRTPFGTQVPPTPVKKNIDNKLLGKLLAARDQTVSGDLGTHPAKSSKN